MLQYDWKRRDMIMTSINFSNERGVQGPICVFCLPPRDVNHKVNLQKLIANRKNHKDLHCIFPIIKFIHSY